MDFGATWHPPRHSIDDEVPPDQVPGYAQALAAGLLPQVPVLPPSPLPGRNFQRTFQRAILVIMTAWCGGPVLMSQVADRLPFLAVMPALLAILACTVYLFGKLGDVAEREWRRGYTTQILAGPRFGSFWMWGSRFRHWKETGERIPWDHSGLWHLDYRSGAVLAAPDPSEIPPGFYPSPHWSGKFELWTGLAWAGKLRDPQRQHPHAA